MTLIAVAAVGARIGAAVEQAPARAGDDRAAAKLAKTAVVDAHGAVHVPVGVEKFDREDFLAR